MACSPVRHAAVALLAIVSAVTGRLAPDYHSLLHPDVELPHYKEGSGRNGTFGRVFAPTVMHAGRAAPSHFRILHEGTCGPVFVRVDVLHGGKFLNVVLWATALQAKFKQQPS